MGEIVKMEEAQGTGDFDLGQWVGRRETFGLVAGRCSAADIEILRKIRDEKMYLRKSASWDEFCAQHLRVARRTVNREIAYLRDFGPAFFTIRQLTHISAADYKHIAPHVSVEGVHLDGAVVPLDPENSQTLAAAIGKLLTEGEESRPCVRSTAFDAILSRCRSTTGLLRKYGESLDPGQMSELASAVAALRRAAAGLGAQIWDR